MKIIASTPGLGIIELDQYFKPSFISIHNLIDGYNEIIGSNNTKEFIFICNENVFCMSKEFSIRIKGNFIGLIESPKIHTINMDGMTIRFLKQN